jgi:3-oxoacyl-ACP reductase-like protein
MAIKADRNLLDTRIDYYMNEVAARGGVAVIGTSSSGVAMDSSVSVATYAALSSGRIPLGILVCDVVDKDLTKTHLNYYKEEVQKG